MDPYHELEHLSAIIHASEDWAEDYNKAPLQHAALIKQVARMERQTMVYFRDLAKETPRLVNWYAYSRAVQEQQQSLTADNSANVLAYDINVVLNQDAVQQNDQDFIKIVFDTISVAQSLGVASMEAEHGMPLAISSTSSIIQSLTTKQLANMVGKKIDSKTGLLVDNPNKAFNIDDTTRNRIAQSIKTSINLGEDQTTAAKRLEKIIANPVRADMIAYTETVRAYAEGRKLYAKQTNAAGKYNSDRSATDVCADNTAQGVIAVDDNFVSGQANEPFHIRCKCLVSYTYSTS